MKRRLILVLTLIVLQLPQMAFAFDNGKSAFRVTVKDLTVEYQRMSITVLPGEVFDITIVDPAPANTYSVEFEGKQAVQTKSGFWTLTAPESKGIHTLVVTNTITEDRIHLNLIVLVPLKEVKNEYLNGYKIGTYPSTPYKNLAVYKPPRGFIEVTEDNADTYLTPHYQIKQFLCKQSGGYPKYVIIRPMLLLKLEAILERVNQAGYDCKTMFIMSGYRTPFYNKAIGNVKYSRHVWEGAADIFIDSNPVDGDMDDLNNDGTINYKDAHVLYNLIDDLYGQKWYAKFVGGLGLYRANANHGPFVHVDVRGYRARWGE